MRGFEEDGGGGVDGSEECGERPVFGVPLRSGDGFTICLRASIRSREGPFSDNGCGGMWVLRVGVFVTADLRFTSKHLSGEKESFRSYSIRRRGHGGEDLAPPDIWKPFPLTWRCSDEPETF